MAVPQLWRVPAVPDSEPEARKPRKESLCSCIDLLHASPKQESRAWRESCVLDRAFIMICLLIPVRKHAKTELAWRSSPAVPLREL